MKKSNRSCFFKLLMFFCCLGLASTVYAFDPPGFLPEFAGGVQDNAVWQDSNFFANANQCNMKTPCGNLSNEPAKFKLCQAQVKACIGNYMTKQGASKQAIAFARYSSIPAMIDKIKRYDNLAVVQAKMQWADADSGYFIINKAGYIVPTVNNIDLSKNPQFQDFLKDNPNAMLWNMPDANKWPRVKTAADGTEQVIFNYPVKVCNACAKLANARIAYQFDANGKYLDTQLLKLVKVRQA